ncbi:osteopetrosis-associated transmembrane protein 1-like [Condylostylus longicornis]|uniref:osteopetrosis-associated transmembrane protein 1-like n=1 Tax=Condylostylus longicornis TaxID=2530218 RepID=UPI00244DDF8C|nr:osteopetrosis-associated transmembrane protein 1-like [Condylostylus longicornis]
MFLKILFFEILLLNVKRFFAEPNSCAELLNVYGDTLENFLRCSMHNAVPVTFCFNCASYYQNLTENFDALMKAEFKEANKTVKCREKYIDQDRLNVILDNHNHFENLWNKAACFGCFLDNTTTNSNETKIMFKKLDDLKNCISSHWDSNVCENCAADYDKANFYYNEEFVKKHKDHICFDIRDDMNRTRSLWSKTLKCCKREADFTTFAVIASVFTCLPLIFYIFSYFFTKYFENLSLQSQTGHRF